MNDINWFHFPFFCHIFICQKTWKLPFDNLIAKIKRLVLKIKVRLSYCLSLNFMIVLRLPLLPLQYVLAIVSWEKIGIFIYLYISKHLELWFSIGGVCPLGKIWEWEYTLGWHLSGDGDWQWVGRDQRCWKTPCKRQSYSKELSSSEFTVLRLKTFTPTKWSKFYRVLILKEDVTISVKSKLSLNTEKMTLNLCSWEWPSCSKSWIHGHISILYQRKVGCSFPCSLNSEHCRPWLVGGERSHMNCNQML
jgi:hypothetical protein